MKHLFSLLIIVSICSFGFAQKKRIAITAFEVSSSEIPQKYVKAIEDKVKESFYTTNRFDIVDRTNLRKLKAEKELQKSEEFIDGKTVKQTSLEGAEQIVTGSVSQVNIHLKKTESSSYYDCQISFSLQVIDVETGQVVASQLIRPQQGFFGNIGSNIIGGNSTPEKSFFNALKGTKKAINKFVGKNFPVKTAIIEITDASSSKAKTLLINIGNLRGAKKNQEFEVFELVNKEINGKKIIWKKELGKIKITNVEGEEISEAKVIKGGDKILTKFNSNSKIECHSKN